MTIKFDIVAELYKNFRLKYFILSHSVHIALQQTGITMRMDEPYIYAYIKSFQGFWKQE